MNLASPLQRDMRDILVFTPVLRLEGETVRALMSLAWDGPLSLLLQRDNPVGIAPLASERTEPKSGAPRNDREVGFRNHLHQYQRGRELFLRGRFDGMLVIESDIIPPVDTLERLAALVDDGADVAYGVYVFRGGQECNVLERYYWQHPPKLRKKARNIGDPLTSRGLYEAACEMGVIECSGSGLGCVLITRKVLEEVPFEAPRGGGFFDWGWTQAVYHAGFTMMADMAVRCGHVDVDGETLWPPSPTLTPGTLTPALSQRERE